MGPTPWARFAHLFRLNKLFFKMDSIKPHFMSWNSSQMLSQSLLHAAFFRAPGPHAVSSPRSLVKIKKSFV